MIRKKGIKKCFEIRISREEQLSVLIYPCRVPSREYILFSLQVREGKPRDLALQHHAPMPHTMSLNIVDNLTPRL